MICGRCRLAEVEVGAVCPTCGTVAVAADLLDSVLSLPAEPVPEPDDEPAGLRPLGAGDGVGVGVERLAGAPDEEWAASTPSGPALDTTPPVWPSTADRLASPEFGPEPGPSGPPLPRRTPIDEVGPQWGPRPHPPAVLAPPPPHPLDAPPPRVARSQGTGLPPGLAGALSSSPSSPPAPTPTAPPTTPSSASATASAPPPVSVPERPSHPRVRRWFGRTAEPESAPPVSTAEAEASEPVEAPAEGPLAGAPAGLLDGVVPEPDLGAGVHDPAGLEAAMGRMSTGARRNALAPLAVVAALLEPGEQAEAVVQGEYQHRPAVVVLTDRRLVVANDRRWAPDVRQVDLEPDVRVHGWQDERRATLVFERSGVGVVVSAISDRPLAVDMAQRVRSRCADGPGASGPTA